MERRFSPLLLAMALGACLLMNAGLPRPAFAVCDRRDTLTFALAGDIMMGKTYPDTLLPAHDGALLFRDAKTVLRRADLALGNLEGTLCEGGKSTKGDSTNTFSFRTPPRYARWLKEAGFGFMSMANNHANDFGLEGIEQTEQALRAQGIAYAGLEGRVESVVLMRKGVRIGICAFGHNPYTVKHLDLKKVKSVLDDFRFKADLVIVSVHGGAEGRDQSHLPYGMEKFYDEERGALRELAHFCIDNGADVVYGHGPHVVRCVEVYKDRFIAYSLGNFCTPYGVSLKGISGYAPLLEIKTDRMGRFLAGRIHSFVQRWGTGPRWDKNRSATKEIRMLTESDIPLGGIRIDADGNVR